MAATNVVNVVVHSFNNNNDSYIALYPVKFTSSRRCTLSTSKSARQSKRYKYYKCIHQYQNDKKARIKQNKKIKNKKEEEA